MKNTYKKIMQNDELLFKLETSFKFGFITLLFALVVLMVTYTQLKITLVYFVQQGFPGAVNFQEAYYAYLSSELIDDIPFFIVGFFIICFLGYYAAVIMIRPFRAIGNCCEERMNNETRFYEPDFFSDLKLLTSFSSFFFSKVDEAKVRGKIQSIEIPEDYTKIHKPILEKNFFVNYLLLIVIITLLASVGLFLLHTELRERIVALSFKFMKNNENVKFFLDQQFEISEMFVNFLLFLHFVVNIIFGIHLYQKVSSPAFAVFATMRSFLKGNYHNRIHLIGYYYLRDHCRKINKYLDRIQKELT